MVYVAVALCSSSPTNSADTMNSWEDMVSLFSTPARGRNGGRGKGSKGGRGKGRNGGRGKGSKGGRGKGSSIARE